jgi:hypothetical protein
LDRLVRAFSLGQATPTDAATRYSRVGSILGLFWERLVAELTTHLDGWVSKARGVRVYDVALLLGPARRGAAPLVRMARVRGETDGEVQRMVCFDGFTYFGRAVTSVVIRCSTAGAVHLHIVDCVHASGLVLEVKRLLALRPRPSVFIADDGADFKGGDSALQDMEKKGQINLVQEYPCGRTMREYYDNLPKPWDVASTEYEPVRELVPSSASYICLTPQTEERLKYRRFLLAVQAGEEHLEGLVRTFWLGQATPADAATRYNKVCSILELFWERLVTELTTHLDGWVSGTGGVRIYDVALLLNPAGRSTAPLVRVARVREETGGEV